MHHQIHWSPLTRLTSSDASCRPTSLCRSKPSSRDRHRETRDYEVLHSHTTRARAEYRDIFRLTRLDRVLNCHMRSFARGQPTAFHSTSSYPYSRLTQPSRLDLAYSREKNFTTSIRLDLRVRIINNIRGHRETRDYEVLHSPFSREREPSTNPFSSRSRARHGVVAESVTRSTSSADRTSSS